ncbi:MAG TPA: hypothetical protein VFU07_09060 [Candidatus Lumbricidophila sp.]|nr:hypothetical protein [Candidatus Lumbricidophila sp.]
MDELLALLAGAEAGVITTAELRAARVNRALFERAVRGGVLAQVRPGAYTAGEAWRAAGGAARHRLFVIASVRLARRAPVVSHLSAAAMHGLPMIGSWPGTVHTLKPEATGGSRSSLRTSHRGTPDPNVMQIDGVMVTSLRRTLLDLALTAPMVVSVTAMDAALHRALRVPGAKRFALSRDILFEELERLGPAHGRRRAEAAIGFADGRSDSPGESLSRVRIFQFGFEVPELQVRFRAVNAGRDAVVDFFWRGIQKVGEFDGRAKYLRGQRAGESEADVVWREKLREDALRTVVNSVNRWTWADAISPETFRRKLTEFGVPRAR